MNFRNLPLLAALAFCAANPAHAGLVTGNWDPVFGASRPGLNWAIQGQFWVPDTCSAADGIYSTASGVCAGAATISLDLRLFNDSADPNNFYEVSSNSQTRTLHANSLGDGGYVISMVRVVAGQAVGFVAGYQGLLESPIHEYFGDVAETLGTSYGAWLDLDGPTVECFQCGPDEVPLYASTAGLTQFLVNYDDEGRPKFTDDQGNPLGAVLDENGAYQGRSPVPNVAAAVPEPGALALVLVALGAALRATRRRWG